MITLSVAQGSAHFDVQESFSYTLTNCTNQLCGVVIWTGRKGDSTFSTSMCLLTTFNKLPGFHTEGGVGTGITGSSQNLDNGKTWVRCYHTQACTNLLHPHPTE